MNSLIDFTILCFSSLFVIVDPIGLVPAFLTMTSNNQTKERVDTARLASVVSFFILTLFALAGQWVFKIFGISLEAFQIAGGILLLFVALEMLHAKRSAVKETPEEQDEGQGK